jgi:hypothetical protein
MLLATRMCCGLAIYLTQGLRRSSEDVPRAGGLSHRFLGDGSAIETVKNRIDPFWNEPRWEVR